jgi:adenylate cyclase
LDAIVIVIVAAAAGLVLSGLGFVAVGRQMSRRRARRALRRRGKTTDLASLMQGAVQLHAKAKELAPQVKDSIQSIVAWAESVRPSARSDLAPDGTITLLFSDIEDSTIINARLGDERWVEELRNHAKLVHDLVKEHDGTVVKSAGDGFMVVFKDPADAVRCAISLQHTLAENPHDGEPLRVRVGIHTGSVISEKGDYFGENVAFAARVAQEANGGEILVSDAVRQRLADVSCSTPRPVELKGIAGTHKVSAVDWQNA